MPDSDLHEPLLGWFATYARDLPWRGEGAVGWPVLVSEVMLQQTPVARVLPVFTAWLARWPTPAALAADSQGEAVRMWGRLGYPRRALRLHAAAVLCVARHGGQVPQAYAELRALPGVGDYTAAAVASFAYRQRHVVLDTNVRRVLARLLAGEEYEPAGSPTVGERAAAEAVLPDDPVTASTWSAALMELGAVVCTARAPRCADCPLAPRCRWRLAGYPGWAGPAAARPGVRRDRPSRPRAAAGPAPRVVGPGRAPRARGRVDRRSAARALPRLPGRRRPGRTPRGRHLHPPPLTASPPTRAILRDERAGTACRGSSLKIARVGGWVVGGAYDEGGEVRVSPYLPSFVVPRASSRLRCPRSRPGVHRAAAPCPCPRR